MAFDPEFNHSISLSDASEMTKKYRESTGDEGPNSAAFGKKAIMDILNQDDCKGIRAYYAENGEDKLTLIIVGVDAAGNDMHSGQLAELAHLCPPFCSGNNPLNS